MIDRPSSPSRFCAVITALAMALAGAARAKPAPDPVARMIEAAAREPEALEAAVRIAKKTNPASIAEIDAQVAQLKLQSEDRNAREAAKQGFFQGWKGKGEAGGSLSTGNTRQEGLALGLEVEKDSRRWWRALDAYGF